MYDNILKSYAMKTWIILSSCLSMYIDVATIANPFDQCRDVCILNVYQTTSIQAWMCLCIYIYTNMQNNNPTSVTRWHLYLSRIGPTSVVAARTKEHKVSDNDQRCAKRHAYAYAYTYVWIDRPIHIHIYIIKSFIHNMGIKIHAIYIYVNVYICVSLRTLQGVAICIQILPYIHANKSERISVFVSIYM